MREMLNGGGGRKKNVAPDQSIVLGLETPETRGWCGMTSKREKSKR